ncbi:MAG TPA: pyruvate carboxylase subunit B [Syntrophus sp. (in: bacteria)]|nr:pyruvate carboxylase subunit B [Syntrophus sp. (in: bacteria)]
MIKITEQALRDGNQSMVASRMAIDDMLPITPLLDRVGFFSLEVWSGSVFECCMRFLNEDPWERLRKFKEKMPRTPLKVLTRAQNLFGFRIFPNDVVYEFTKVAVKNGCNVFSIFDSLNDMRNMEVSIRAVKKEGAIAEACVLYAINPIYTVEKFVEIGKTLEGFGSDIFAIHDSSGILAPSVAFDLVQRLKKELKIPVCLHFHCTTGMAMMSYWEGCRAGADIVDTCMSPLSGGASLPATEGMVAGFMGTQYDPKFDMKLLNDVKEYFSKLWEKYSSHYSRVLFEIDMGAFLHQLPSGMLSHLMFQLKQANALDKYEQVLKEVPAVLRDFGYPPLATPSSQIVASQAAMNVITGKRYQLISTEVKNYVRGMYGKPPGEISEEVMVKVLGKNWEKEVFDGRPADRLEPELPRAEEEARKLGIVSKPEDVLTYIFYPKVFQEFLTNRRSGV